MSIMSIMSIIAIIAIIALIEKQQYIAIYCNILQYIYIYCMTGSRTNNLLGSFFYSNKIAIYCSPGEATTPLAGSLFPCSRLKICPFPKNLHGGPSYVDWIMYVDWIIFTIGINASLIPFAAATLLAVWDLSLSGNPTAVGGPALPPAPCSWPGPRSGAAATLAREILFEVAVAVALAPSTPVTVVVVGPLLRLHCCRRWWTAMATEGAMCGVNNREGSRRRAWYDRYVDNLYRTVIPGKIGDGTDRFRF